MQEMGMENSTAEQVTLTLELYTNRGCVKTQVEDKK